MLHSCFDWRYSTRFICIKRPIMYSLMFTMTVYTCCKSCKNVTNVRRYINLKLRVSNLEIRIIYICFYIYTCLINVRLIKCHWLLMLALHDVYWVLGLFYEFALNQSFNLLINHISWHCCLYNYQLFLSEKWDIFFNISNFVYNLIFF